jgi:intracellular sulfur oxidation DsrE/DsrF family protein
LVACGTMAQSAGGLYIAGAGYDFPDVAERALAQNPHSRFYLLAVGDAVRFLSLTAPEELVAARRQVARGDVVFLVCQRDLDAGKYRLFDLVPGVVPVKGWTPAGSAALPVDQKYYPDEDPTRLPSSTEQLRRLRATCS